MHRSPAKGDAKMRRAKRNAIDDVQERWHDPLALDLREEATQQGGGAYTAPMSSKHLKEAKKVLNLLSYPSVGRLLELLGGVSTSAIGKSNDAREGLVMAQIV
jgi:hypothetical protein